ncbi:CRISPR-associated protein Cas4 [Psychrobacter phenylpyruvicus]|uniref:CRISPR-associated exonuclease Cas4 n=1 Tax=Psychrobacter phenylpyruvicus TaxID=29432 RepID=A0A379LLB8_9GAMM|nr:CRISPR-associated protein Cas4 [Psychrobacter phenylpyruvicus]SUD90572.1 CRISPR-associated protein Cas4 [Psychrobacter phenylpyruvicus]
MQTLYLSRLQHYLFCPRQFALIELECAWEENIFTAEGQVMHEKVNSGGHDTRGAIKTVRTLPLGHRTLGLEGVADVVEYHANDDGSQTPYPIEYKRGRPKSHRADEVQLCAQALCLEDMHQCHVPEGALFYGKTRRRHTVVFDDELRQITVEAIQACRHIIDSGKTPKPSYSTSKCRNCSLKDICHPKIFNKNAKAWLNKYITESLKDNLND